MQWLELNNVEYGDCTVLGGKSHSILMVDCGSMNQKLRNPEMDMSDVFTAIRERYGDMTEKHFLLTHYHRDHLCGLLQILRESPSYFDRVYIPYLPKDAKGNSPLLDFAIFARAFLPVQTDCSQVNTSCLGIFNKLKTSVGADRIFTLKAGEFFFF
ncbi:MAG: MBL fold metallo-hydrolase, partial [Oscillospiraceae bacterium]